jgi:intein/homing endonuclease
MKTVPFILNPPQQQLLKELGGNDIILKARQEGISSLIAAMFAVDFITIENIRCVIISHEDKATQRLFDRVRFFLDSMKKTFPGELPYRLTRSSTHELKNEVKNSYYYIGTAGARAFGHGETINDLHVSELSRWPEQEKMMTGLMQAVPKDGRIIIETTANGYGDYFNKLWTQNKETQYPFKTHFIPWFKLPEYVLPASGLTTQDLIDEEKELITNYGLTLEQLAWRRWKINQMGGDFRDPKTWDIFKEQFPSTAEEAFIVSGNPVWSPTLMNYYLAKCRKPKLVGNLRGYDPISVEENERGYLKVWKEPEEFHTYAIGCLPDGEEVLTDSGSKAIETVGSESKLVNENGRFVSIVNFQRRFYKGKIFELQPCYTPFPTKFTEEHPIQVLKDTNLYRDTAHKLKRYYKTEVIWKKAKDILPTDILRFPILYKDKLSSEEILSRFPNQGEIRIDRRIEEKSILEKDFWFFMGLWLAEGWIRNGGEGKRKEINVVLNGFKEKELADEIIKIIKRIFSRDVVYQHRRNTYEIKFSSEAIYHFIKSNFGQKAEGKSIPEWIKYLPEELKLEFFRGYWLGDGCLKKEGKNNKRINCVSVSGKLLNDFQDILLSLGIISSVKVLREEGVHFFKGKGKCFTRKAYELNIASRESQILFDKWGMEIKNNFIRSRHKAYGWIEDGYLYLKIQKLSSFYFEGWVNNFETETHSYCVRFISTHNCDVAEGKVVLSGDDKKDRDFSCAQVFDKTTYEQVAVWYGNIDPDVLGIQLDMLGRYYNDALIGVERNAVGITPLIKLRDLNYPHLYYREKLGLITEKITSELGWTTTNQSKEQLISEATELLRDKRISLYDEDTVSEMRSFVRNVDGKAGATKGRHDDRVMGFLIAIKMLSKAKSSSYANEIEEGDMTENSGFFMGGASFDSRGMPVSPDQMGELGGGDF